MSTWSTGSVVNEHRAIVHEKTVVAVATTASIAARMVRLLNLADQQLRKGGEDHGEAGAIHGEDQGR